MVGRHILFLPEAFWGRLVSFLAAFDWLEVQARGFSSKIVADRVSIVRFRIENRLVW